MNDHLRTGLDAGADAYEIPPGDLDRVVGRARQRTRRRHRITASLAALTLVAGTAGALRLADGDGRIPVTTETASQLGDAGIAWARADDPQSALGGFYTQSIVEAGGASYAVSTTPGQSGERALWRSDDGLEWRQVANPDAFFVDDLGASDGRLYAIGTGPGTRDAQGQKVPDLRLGSSEAGSDEWTSRSLPIDVDAIAAATSDLYVVDQDVAATSSGVVATVSLRGTIDARVLLPGVAMPNGWTIDRDGLTVLGEGPGCPEGAEPEKQGEGPPGQIDQVWCGDRRSKPADPAAAESMKGIPAEDAYGVASRHTWAELGVGGDVLKAVLGTPFVFHAAGHDGELAPTEPPLRVDRLGGTTTIEAVDGGFVLLDAAQIDYESPSPLDVFRSADGVTWQRDGSPGGISWAHAVGTVDGRLAVVGQSSDGAAYAELHADGWRTTSLAGLVGDDGEYSFVSAAGIGPLGVVVGLGTSAEGDDTTYRLLSSRDGSTWQADDLATLLAGTRSRGGVSQVTIAGDRAVVNVRTDIGDLEKTGRAAIVGTPR